MKLARWIVVGLLAALWSGSAWLLGRLLAPNAAAPGAV